MSGCELRPARTHPSPQHTHPPPPYSDKWLVEGGGVYPNRATMYMAGCARGGGAKEVFWKDVYGFDMSAM